ncbi:flagellar basal-body rod protein FlgF [Caulobacter ginsengisoli]|uniref:Flagellar basal-body rod protein FlgF n=1 Tax=Caulobacter ginsengisoli TaxID=400775 RepID=A0ABU0IK53_9CAUL|nr:flagellar basal-body rod protein FlgF [Caulobacter ginsengisoli]MDQ0462367.1 flagellar basal-body rod protein FlgF [Caulobacter ginsengisoli]
MDNAMYVVLSRQMTLRRELDVVANNLANADTTGFKVEALQVRTDTQAPARMADGPKTLKFVLDDEVVRDFTQGSMQQTGGTFDLGIDGRGFFKIQTADGERYTRDGRFTLSPEGKLTTQDGDPVMGDGGEIVLDPAQGPVNIAPDGSISQGPQRVGKVAVVDFSDLSVLRKDGDNLFRNVSNLQPTTATAAQVRQGMLEGSNVNSILQVTRLIEISRSYESMAKSIDNTSDLSRRAVERLGRVA